MSSPGAPGTVSVAGPQSATVGQGTNLLARFIEQWKASPLLKLISAVLLIYALLTQNPMMIVIGIAVGFAVRFLVGRLEGPLAPFWPIRDILPKPVRLVLAFLVPMFIAWKITTTPGLAQKLAFIPSLGQDTSVFATITGICALVACLLVQERAKA